MYTTLDSEHVWVDTNDEGNCGFEEIFGGSTAAAKRKCSGCRFDDRLTLDSMRWLQWSPECIVIVSDPLKYHSSHS